MKKLVLWLSVVCLFSLSSSFGQEISFPLLEAENLNGKRTALPKDLPGDPTLVLVAFVSDQQEEIDLWIKELKLKETDDIKWIELAVVGSKYRLLKPVIDAGMRSGITEEKDRERTITVYCAHSHFLEKLGLEKTDQIYAVVAKPDGSVKKIVEGKPTEASKKAVLEALGK